MTIEIQLYIRAATIRRSRGLDKIVFKVACFV